MIITIKAAEAKEFASAAHGWCAAFVDAKWSSKTTKAIKAFKAEYKGDEIKYGGEYAALIYVAKVANNAGLSAVADPTKVVIVVPEHQVQIQLKRAAFVGYSASPLIKAIKALKTLVLPSINAFKAEIAKISGGYVRAKKIMDAHDTAVKNGWVVPDEYCPETSLYSKSLKVCNGMLTPDEVTLGLYALSKLK